MEQVLKPGELPVSGTDTTRLANIQHNLRLRQQRGGGHGYLLDAEAEYLLPLARVGAGGKK